MNFAWNAKKITLYFIFYQKFTTFGGQQEENENITASNLRAS